MNSKRTCFSFLVVMLLSCASAFGWNCSDPLASRVPVGTTQPAGSAGNGDGQWFLGTGNEGTKGVYYVCQVPKKNGGGSGNPTTNTNTNTNNSSSTSGAVAGSSSTSGASATGGNSSSNSGVSGSGNSTIGPISTVAKGGAGGSVKDSGNSSNTNNNTAQGGSANGNGSNNTTTATGGTVSGSGNSTQGQKQGQEQSASANNTGGNSSNSYSSTTNIAAPKIPVNTAYAPTTIPTSPCLKGYEAGGQSAAFGFALGGSKVDKNCQMLELARSFDSMNERLAGCKVKVAAAKRIAKDAEVSVDDCMVHELVDAPVVVTPAAPVAPQQPTVIVVPVPQAPAAPAVAPTPIPVISENIPLGICTFAGKTSCTAKGSDAAIVDPTRPTSVCKEMLAAARHQLELHPGFVIVLRGNRNPSEDVLLPATRANRVRQQLEASGVQSSKIKTEVGTGDTRTVEILLAPAAK